MVFGSGDSEEQVYEAHLDSIKIPVVVCTWTHAHSSSLTHTHTHTHVSFCCLELTFSLLCICGSSPHSLDDRCHHPAREHLRERGVECGVGIEIFLGFCMRCSHAFVVTRVHPMKNNLHFQISGNWVKCTSA